MFSCLLAQCKDGLSSKDDLSVIRRIQRTTDFGLNSSESSIFYVQCRYVFGHLCDDFIIYRCHTLPGVADRFIKDLQEVTAIIRLDPSGAEKSDSAVLSVSLQCMRFNSFAPIIF